MSFASLASGARGVMAQLEATERERSKIPSLKVRYNQVFGYYIEITKAHLDRVPPDYERKQTLVSAERFTTPGLKELERKILSAESGLKELELQIFAKLQRDLQAHSAAILETARAVGEFDAIMSLAKAARRRGYIRPQMNTGLAPRDARRTPSGARNRDERRRVRPQRPRRRRRFAPTAADHRPQHGRQIDLPPPGRADRDHGADGQLRSRRRGEASGWSTSADANRRARRIAPRRIHLHGRDARDGAPARRASPSAACCCSTRSGAAPAPSTGWRSRGRSPNICTTRLAPRCCSRLISMS